MTNLPDMITTTEACEILGVHRATLLRWIGEGSVTSSRKLAGQTTTWLHDRAEIQALATTKATA